MKEKPLVGIIVFLLLTAILAVFPIQPVRAGSYDGLDLAQAVLANLTTLITSYYTDTDTAGHRQAGVFSSLGNLQPTDGSSFIFLSTGVAGMRPVTTNGLNPGNERGNWFQGGQYGMPRDRATLTLTLQVPLYMHYLYYDIQFFTVEYPDYLHTQYNDKFTITVNSPSKGTTSYIIDVNSGDFVLTALDPPLLDTGFNVFATDGNPGTPSNGVDWLTTTPNPTGADAGATAPVGREHPVSPGEQITITFDIIDAGDNQFDSTAFIDNLRFSGFAKTEIIARKTVQDENGGFAEPGDVLKYTLTISNIGTAPQNNNPGYEFEDLIPAYTHYVPGSATASLGTVTYDSQNNKILWDGGIATQSSVALNFKVTINSGIANGVKISNQGTVHWDSNEDGVNDANELTDDPAIDDGIDQDGDGDTFDDDPTNITVSSWEAPSYLEETFVDDTPNGKATQSYMSIPWFETSTRSVKSNFGVAGIYQYITPRSFKVKLRASDSPQYWNYSLAPFNCDVSSWEVRFACGNHSEAADLQLSFKNTDGNLIAKIKFDYQPIEGAVPSSNHTIKLFYLAPDQSWRQISSAYPGGYLYNAWYKLRIEKNGTNQITYKLYQDINHVTQFADQKTNGILGSAFSRLKCIEWQSTKNPVVCPIIFFDEHRIDLIDL